MRLLLIVFAAVVTATATVAAADAKSRLVLEIVYPKSTPLPAGSRFVQAPVTTWVQSISDLAASSTTVYVSGAAGIQRLDAKTNRFTTPFVPNVEAADIAYDNGLVWASDYDGDAVRAIDETTGAVVATVRLPAGSSPEGVVAADGSIWVAEHHGGAVARIDPATFAVVGTITVGPTGSSGPQGLAFGAGSLWLSVPNLGQVVRIDPATGAVVARVRVPQQMSPCGGIAVGVTSAWVTGCLDDTWVARISLATNKVVRLIDLHARSIEPVAQGDTAWFLVGRDPDDASAAKQHAYLVRLSSADRVLRRYDLGRRFTPGGTTIALGSLSASSFTTPWVARVPLG